MKRPSKDGIIRYLTLFLMLMARFSAAAADEPVLWLEAEAFQETGGWANDSQFVDLMGSPYLLAAGVGHPVADAVTHANIPAAGSYRLWVRAKDWLPNHSPGRFQVIVGGKACQKTLGQADKDAWQWVNAGTFDLAAGDIEVRLHDLTGWWGRCDALVLAHPGFQPADDPNALAQQREKYNGVSREIDDRRGYDVVVVGGGLSGCGAAVAAARHGCRVALLQDRPVLGGNSSSEIQVPVEGDRSGDPWDPFDTGLIEEFYPEMRDTGQSKRLEAIVRREKLIDLHLDTRATGMEMKDRTTIAAILAMNTRTGKRLQFAAPLFIDCTGHGWVGYWAGAEWRMGEEARAEYNEPSAPVQATKRTMGNDLHNADFRTHKRPVPFTAPAWAYHWPSPDDFEPAGSHRRQSAGRPPNFDLPSHGKGRRPRDNDPNGSILHCWEVELGGMSDTIHDAEKIRDELFRINVGLWDFAKNHNPKVQQENINRELIWLNYVMGVRESRRLIGDYMLTENDYIQQTIHPDTVTYTGWGMDTHHPEGFWVRGNDCMHYYRRVKVSVPYRSLYSRNIDNLLMAGRCHSATHLGMSGTRIMRTCCGMGQAAGTAAALIKQYQASPRGIYQQYVAELQQMLLKDGCYLLGVPNRDPADLALKARATASSSAAASEAAGDFPHGGTVHRLDIDRAVMFSAAGGQVESVALYLQNETERSVQVRAALRAAEQFGDFSAAADLSSASGEVPSKSRGWVEFPLRAELSAKRSYFIFLPATEGLKWHLYPAPMKECSRAYREKNGAMHRMAGTYKFRLSPGGEPLPAIKATSCGPENVNNGWNRAVDGVRNAWVPDLQHAKLPQRVQLELPEPAGINTMHVSFQTRKDRAVDFQVQAMVEGSWKTVAEVRENPDRRRILHFTAVRTDKIRLVLDKVTGQVGVCEIRLYREGDQRGWPR